jgi:hypothetical protein
MIKTGKRREKLQPRPEKTQATRMQQLCAPLYAVLYAELRLVAKGHGYALCAHGTLGRDLDLVAVPWVEKCSTPEQLADAFNEYIGCDHLYGKQERPHGRWNFVYHLSKTYGQGPYIDLSVMPPILSSVSTKKKR